MSVVCDADKVKSDCIKLQNTTCRSCGGPWWENHTKGDEYGHLKMRDEKLRS
jgi:hypothetical protein